jgi:hypothetical protein
MSSPWSYDELTKTAMVYDRFNVPLTGLPADTAKIIFYEYVRDSTSSTKLDNS